MCAAERFGHLRHDASSVSFPPLTADAAPAALAAAGGATAFEGVLLSIAVTLLAAKLLGGLVQRVGQPSVLGELVAGMLIGPHLLGLIDPAEPILHALSEIGVLVLLLEIGLHTDLRSLARVGTTALAAGGAGVFLPFVGGFGVARVFGVDVLPAVVLGAALTATSIGISARVLSDIGQLKSPAGQVVLGAAVFDDVIGLVILSIVASLVAGAALTIGSITRTTAIAFGFIVAAVAIGTFTMPALLRAVDRVRASGTMGVVAIAFALLLAWLGAISGSAMIIGAFAAGLVLHPTQQHKDIQHTVTHIGAFFVPIFFAVVGAQADLRAMFAPAALALGAALLVVAVLGKLAAGYVPWRFTGDKLLVGVALVPRGEVGLIFAQMGLATGALSDVQFGALMLVVVITTFLTPPLLGRIAVRGTPDRDSAPDGRGIDDLVVGAIAPRQQSSH